MALQKKGQNTSTYVKLYVKKSQRLGCPMEGEKRTLGRSGVGALPALHQCGEDPHQSRVPSPQPLTSLEV